MTPARIIMVSGKGGVGKTTTAAATAVAAARKGKRTLVMSFDLAHSLSDSFNLDHGLFEQNAGRPIQINERLSIQEIDIQAELERNWSEIYQYTAQLMVGRGMDEVVAEEVAIMPGMEDIIALMFLNEHAHAQIYDVIVVDMPPTAEALRFVSFSGTLDWYVRKRFNLDRKISEVARPIARMLGKTATDYVPDDEYFGAVKRVFERLDGIDKILRRPDVTSVRLVTNAEKMVVRETQRAYMYFSMYGMTIDRVVVNRLLPEVAAENAFFADWVRTQTAYTAEIRAYFDPVDVVTMPLFRHEVIGEERLVEFSDQLYGDADPSQFFVQRPPYGFSKQGSQYQLSIHLPFVEKQKIDLHRNHENLIVRVGSFKRHVLLPRAIVPLEVTSADMNQGRLSVYFGTK
jgi:arsenite-transporting ATPase